MKRFFLFLLVAGVLSGPLYAAVPTEVQQQTKRAQITLRAIANQLAHFYAQHGYYPSTAFSDTAFAAIGMKEPPSKTWDYFFECKLYSCDITAEHKRRHYTPDDLVGITPILRLTVRKRKVDPIIHVEARTIWFMQKGDTTLLMEENYAAPREICYWFGGRKDTKLGCIID